MAEKGFGVKEINLIGASGTPTIESPNNLNLNAVNVAISTNATIGGNLTVTGNIGIAGTLTYEDVTNIDAIGIVTARTGLKVLAGGANVVGVVTGTAFDGKIKVIASNSVAATVYPTFAGSGATQSGNLDLKTDNSLTYNSLSGELTAASFTGSGANLTGIAVTEAPVTDYTITADSGSNYYFHGGGVDETDGNPDLYLIRGQKYRFNNTTGNGHPFAIRVSNGGSAYTDGVSGSQSGIQFFTVPYAAPASLVYQCTIHGGMIGNIYIRGGSSTVTVSSNANNRVITGGSGGNLNGEANLTFDGSTLGVSGGITIASHPVLSYASHLGTYATRLGSTGTSTLRHTQLFGGGSLFAEFNGVDTNQPGFFKGSVGIQTDDLSAANLANPVGAGHSLVGLYIGDGSLLFSDQLARSGGYYITTGVNALNAGPVTLNSEMTLDGTWTIV